MSTDEVITRLKILAIVFRDVGHDNRETTCRQAASELEALQKKVEELEYLLSKSTGDFAEFRKHAWEQQDILRKQLWEAQPLATPA